MAKGVKPRVKVPKTASAGEMVTLKTLISHKMESGQRKDSDGNKIPRSIIHRFTCAFNGKTVVDVEMVELFQPTRIFHLMPLFLKRVSFTLLGTMMTGRYMRRKRK